MKSYKWVKQNASKEPLPLEEQYANACLIAAAPELLQLAKSYRVALRMLNCGCSKNKVCDGHKEVDSIISKAEGRE